jgi:hypothetical protein
MPDLTKNMDQSMPNLTGLALMVTVQHAESPTLWAIKSFRAMLLKRQSNASGIVLRYVYK